MVNGDFAHSAFVSLLVLKTHAATLKLNVNLKPMVYLDVSEVGKKASKGRERSRQHRSAVAVSKVGHLAPQKKKAKD